MQNNRQLTLKAFRNKLWKEWRAIEHYQKGKRIITHSRHASPDFMVIGVAKCGTTSLFQYLAQHPQLLPPKNKEVKYFGMQHQKYGLDWYLRQFPLKKHKKKGKLVFEATPTYIYLKQAAKTISFLYPRMKSIVILRDPVKRAFSHWTWLQPHSVNPERHVIDRRSFEDAVAQELNNKNAISKAHRYLDRGKYAKQLKQWYKYFDEQQILILDFEDLKCNIKRTMATVTKFLEVDNIYQDFKLTDEALPGVLEQKDLNNHHKIKKYNSSLYKGSMNKETEAMLREYFEPFDAELQELTGRTFSWME